MTPLLTGAAGHRGRAAAGRSRRRAADAATPPPRRRQQQLNLLQLVLHASLPVQLVMLLLLFGSIASWVIIFRKKRVLDRADARSRRVRGALLVRRRARPSSMPARPSATATSAAWKRSSKAASASSPACASAAASTARMQLEGAQRAMRATASREIDGLEHNLEFLANVGSISPYVGLFGTVWGIMISFQGLANVKEATIATVAPGISEALIATAMGLFAAIPAVWAYNRFATKVERIGGALRRLRRGVLLDPAAPGAPRRDLMRTLATSPQPASDLARACVPAVEPLGLRAGIGHDRHHRAPPSQAQAQGRDQRRALHRRDAGAADHLHGHRAAAQPRRRHRPAAVQRASRSRTKKDPVVVSVDADGALLPDARRRQQRGGHRRRRCRPRCRRSSRQNPDVAGVRRRRRARPTTRR